MQGIGRRALGGLTGWGLTAAALGGISPAPAQTAPTPAAAEIRLGAVFPLSGPSALLGDESFRGVELAIEERNAAGGVSGRQLRLVRADAPDDVAASTEARRLVQGNDKVAAIFGSFSSAIALPASQVAELAGVPFFELGALGDALMERGFRWVFRLSPRAADFAATSVEAVVDVLAPSLNREPASIRLGIAHEEAEGGQSIGAAQEAAIKSRGLLLVDRSAYASRPADLSAVVQRLRGLEAEVILHSGAPGDETLLFRALHDASWRPRMVIGSAGGYGLAETARSIGDDMTGAMSADLTPFAVNERAAPGARAFAEAYLRRYGAEPRSGHGLAAFSGARAVLDALQRAGSADKDRLRAAVLATEVEVGGLPCGWGVKFDERGQNVRARPFLCQWQAAPAGGGLRQVVIAPATAAAADPLAKLGI